jgi:hypothetical protein
MFILLNAKWKILSQIQALGKKPLSLLTGRGDP